MYQYGLLNLFFYFKKKRLINYHDNVYLFTYLCRYYDYYYYNEFIFQACKLRRHLLIQTNAMHSMNHIQKNDILRLNKKKEQLKNTQLSYVFVPQEKKKKEETSTQCNSTSFIKKRKQIFVRISVIVIKRITVKFLLDSFGSRFLKVNN